MAGRSTAKEEPRHTAARSSPFPRPQLFPAAPSSLTTISPSLAGFLLPERRLSPRGSTALGPLPSPPLEGVLGVRGARRRGLTPGVPGAGPGAHGAWERVPAPGLPLCLHVTFPVWRKWCRGEVPAGTGRHVTGLQPSLGRAGGNPERRGESSPRTLFPSGAGRLLQRCPCSLGSAPHPVLPWLPAGAGRRSWRRGCSSAWWVCRSSHEASKELGAGTGREQRGSLSSRRGTAMVWLELIKLPVLLAAYPSFIILSLLQQGRGGVGMCVQHLLDMRGAPLVNHFPRRPQLSQPCLLPTQASSKIH